MLVTGQPQFDTQNDTGIGDGIPSIPEWQLGGSGVGNNLDQTIASITNTSARNVFVRLRRICERAEHIPLSATPLHDLAAFVLHRLIPSTARDQNQPSSPFSECIRHGISLYMLVLQGPTYFSHAVLLNTLLVELDNSIRLLNSKHREPQSTDVWMLSIGMVAAQDTRHASSFAKRAQIATSLLKIQGWDFVLSIMKQVLWLPTEKGEQTFSIPWRRLFDAPLYES